MLTLLTRLYEKYQTKIEEDGMCEANKSAIRYVINHLIGRPLKRIVRPITQPPFIYYHSRFGDKWNILNKDWDLLIILDTCRPDALHQLRDEYDFINNVDPVWSVGSSSSEWVLNTFNKKYESEISDIAYISSNPYSHRILKNNFNNPHLGYTKLVTKRLKKYAATSPVDTTAFHSCNFLWEPSVDYGPTRYPSPRSVTNHAINLDRSEDSPPRMILHYMPPHSPYIARLINGEIEFGEPRQRGFDAYLDNLRWGLNEVSLLIDNVNRDKVIITADHGENFRLRPIRSGHTPGMITPAVRQVPWVKTSASDKETHRPDLSQINEKNETIDVEETLEALGYMS